MGSHSHSHSETIPDVIIAPENATSFWMLLLCWVLTPFCFKLCLLKFEHEKGLSRLQNILCSALQLTCFSLSLGAVAIAYIPNLINLAIIWALVLVYSLSILLVGCSSGILRVFVRIGMFFGFCVIPFVALWMYSALVLDKTDTLIGDGFGHLIPGCFVAVLFTLALTSKDFADLQRREANYLLIGSVCTFFMHVVGTQGSVLGNLVRHDSTNAMKNQQHSVDLVALFIGGLIAKVFLHYGWLTGFHILIAGVANLVTMLQHPQPTETAKVVHVSFGTLLVVAGLLRSFNRVPEFMLVGVIGAFNFPASTPQICYWTEAWAANSFTYLFLYIASTASYFCLFLVLFIDPATIKHWRTGADQHHGGAVSTQVSLAPDLPLKTVQIAAKPATPPTKRKRGIGALMGAVTHPQRNGKSYLLDDTQFVDVDLGVEVDDVPTSDILPRSALKSDFA